MKTIRRYDDPAGRVTSTTKKIDTRLEDSIPVKQLRSRSPQRATRPSGKNRKKKTASYRKQNKKRKKSGKNSKTLLQQSTHWHKANILRDYLNAMEQKAKLPM